MIHFQPAVLIQPVVVAPPTIIHIWRFCRMKLPEFRSKLWGVLSLAFPWWPVWKYERNAVRMSTAGVCHYSAPRKKASNGGWKCFFLLYFSFLACTHQGGKRQRIQEQQNNNNCYMRWHKQKLCFNFENLLIVFFFLYVTIPLTLPLVFSPLSFCKRRERLIYTNIAAKVKDYLGFWNN